MDELNVPKDAQPPGFTVEWHRPAVGRRLFDVWWLPATMIVVGAACLAVAGILGDDPSAYIPLTVVGLPLTIAGPYMGIRGLFGIFSEDDFLEVRSTGLRARVGREIRYEPWQSVDSIEPNAQSRGIVILFEESDDWVIPHSFLGFSDEDLAKHLMELRTKGLMGLLRPTPTWREASKEES